MDNLEDFEVDGLNVRRSGEVGVITIARPQVKNAISHELEAELHRALDVASNDDLVRSVVLTGTGDSFSTGYDLNAAVDDSSTSRLLHSWWNVDQDAPQRHLHIMKLDKPVIAAVNGWCLGGGFWYALCADITIASDRAVFGQPEVREGQNTSFLFAALSGWKNAHRYGLTGDHFDANEALRIGVVNEVVEAENLLHRAIEIGNRLAKVPSHAVRINKAITTFGLEAMGLTGALTTGAALSVITHSSGDSDELSDLHRVRQEEGLKESLRHRDEPFLPEPGGPRSR